MKKIIYGVKPYFKDEGPYEVEEETAELLLKSGKARMESVKSEWLTPRTKVLELAKETKIDPKVAGRRKKQG